MHCVLYVRSAIVVCFTYHGFFFLEYIVLCSCSYCRWCKQFVQWILGLFTYVSFQALLPEKVKTFRCRKKIRNKTYILTLQQIRVQELCESRGGRLGLSVLMSLAVSVDVKQHWTVLRHWSQFVPSMSTGIRGHEALLVISIVHRTLMWIFNVRMWSFCMRVHKGDLGL